MLSFTTDLLQNGNNVGIVIPDAVVAQLGGKRVLVVVTLNGEYSYRNTTAVMSGLDLVGLSAEHRVASGLSGGDTVEVTIERDDSPREAVRTSAAPPSSMTVAKSAQKRCGRGNLASHRRRQRAVLAKAAGPDLPVHRIHGRGSHGDAPLPGAWPGTSRSMSC